MGGEKAPARACARAPSLGGSLRGATEDRDANNRVEYYSETAEF